jgi:outer membrane protein OmpA-like peptidoglycan-associated protein
MGIAYRQLSVKFLFNPGTTQFWVDERINSPYPMWLRQIAYETMAAKVCLEIAGHTSRTGSASANQALSLRRAKEIQRRLVAEDVALKSRIKVQGLGFTQNLIGTGSDDAIDVLDRRVEFRIMPCVG